MRYRRLLALWLVIALCGTVVLGAMTWLTRGALASEAERLTAQRDRAVAEARADLEERTRLALWRMDALGAAIVLRENLVRVEQYRDLPKAGLPPAPEVLLRFEILGDPRPVTSETLAPDAQARAVAGERLERLGRLLAETPLPGEFIGEETGLLEKGRIEVDAGADMAALLQTNAMLRQSVPADQLRKDDDYQQTGNIAERAQRARVVGKTVQPTPQADALTAEPPAVESRGAAEPEATGGLQRRSAPAREAPAVAPMAIARSGVRAPGSPAQQSESVRGEPANRAVAGRPAAATADEDADEAAPADDAPRQQAQAPAEVRMVPVPVPVPVRDEVGLFQAAWLGSELLLTRRITPQVTGEEPQAAGWAPPSPRTQGVWLDAAALTAMLLREVADLLPLARLMPALDDSAATDPLALVSFPFKLDRNETPLATAVPTQPAIGAPLWIAWGAVLLAFFTTAALLFGVVRLSERRASFVSAVTHELRTPLTTFRLYSDMLEQGVVTPEKRAGYLSVLAREADRLSHLVENVLTFSRIERGNARANVRDTEVAEMLESFRQRFESRLSAAGLRLVIDAPPGPRIRADLAAVEHILFNLIDNAAKYAAKSDPPEIAIRARAVDGLVEIAVADHGPGIPRADRHRIFRPFHKSASQAAETKPGVGLGLALSRRLARAQKGDLLVDGGSSGACFILRLPPA